MNHQHRFTNRMTKLALCLGGLASLAASGCSSESLRVALETQRRADQVQQGVFDRQHEALRILLYRDLVSRLEARGAELSPAQRAALNEIWNDRDLIEFWAVQHERAKALRIVGVDAKLFSDQSIVDLLVKSVEARVDRANQGLAAHAGRQVAAPEEW